MKTKRIKIAVLVDEFENVAISLSDGVKPEADLGEVCAWDFMGSEVTRIAVIEADIPLPEVETVQGSVMSPEDEG